MSKLDENRVPSAKTLRGSQNPNRSTEYDSILQSTQPDSQSTVHVEDVRRLLALGTLLSSVLTMEELEALGHQAPE